ncbi:uncharacterized protein [Argopecten irradians]|uniref:uncharacterized protein n=1 Tax=Argopecten irradians TaxID=31199 RepID=UPI00371DBF6A
MAYSNKSGVETRKLPPKDYKAMHRGTDEGFEGPSGNVECGSDDHEASDRDDPENRPSQFQASQREDSGDDGNNFRLQKAISAADEEIRELKERLSAARTTQVLQQKQQKIRGLRKQLEELDRREGVKDDPCCNRTGSPLVTLKKDLKESMKAAFAAGTQQNLQTQWKAYFLFCEAFGLVAIPTCTEVLCLFIQFLSRSMKSSDSIRNYVSGVKSLHLLSDIPFEVRSYEVNLALRGISRLNPHLPVQAAPITPSILQDIYRILDLSDPSHASFWCLFLFAFFLLLRKSNLVADTVNTFDRTKQLLRQDVYQEGNLLLVVLKWSKTNQFGRRLVRSPLIAIPESPLCPVKAFKHMCALLPAPPSSPAFLLPEGKKLRPVTYPKLQSFLRDSLARAGYNSKLFSSHSFRRGGASWAFRCQVPGELIQLQGDWASDAYKAYLDFSLEDKLAVCRHVRDAIIVNQTR